MGSAMNGFVTLISLGFFLYFVMVMYKGGGFKGIQNVLKGQPVVGAPTPTPTPTTTQTPTGEQKPLPDTSKGITPTSTKKTTTKKKDNGNDNGNGGDDDDEDEDDNDENGNGDDNGNGNGNGNGDSKSKGKGKSKSKGPVCKCPSKPACDALCNSPSTFDGCCPDIGGKLARRQRVFNAHMMAYLANS